MEIALCDELSGLRHQEPCSGAWGSLANQCRVFGHDSVIIIGMSISGFRYYVGERVDEERRSQIPHVCCATVSCRGIIVSGLQ